MSNVINPRAFTHSATKAQASLAAAMAKEIKAVIYSYEARVPLALALGVLRIVERELQNEHE